MDRDISPEDGELIDFPAGKPVQVVLENADGMQHNFVLTAPGKMQEVALAGEVPAVETLGLCRKRGADDQQNHHQQTSHQQTSDNADSGEKDSNGAAGGSVTAGNFCGPQSANNRKAYYTLHFTAMCSAEDEVDYHALDAAASMVDARLTEYVKTVLAPLQRHVFAFVWLPREDQLRTLLRSSFRTLRRAVSAGVTSSSRPDQATLWISCQPSRSPPGSHSPRLVATST